MMRLLSGLLALTIPLLSVMVPLGTPSNFLAAADSQQPITLQISSYNLGSPSILGNSMWLSGAADASEASSSEIYASSLDDQSEWSIPTPVFSLSGYEVSDPSVVTSQLDSSTLLMYYTKLPNVDAASSSAALDNQIGLAESNDDGQDWQDVGVVVSQNNGIDTRGGWAPSALPVDGQIWVYFSTNGPGNIAVYRARFDASGQQLLGTDTVYLGSGTTTPLSLFNVDVSWDGSQYVMLANPNLSSIVQYVSSDGVHWNVPQNGAATVITADDSSIVGAPAAQYDDNGSASLLFAGGSLSGNRWDSINQVSYTETDSGATTYQHSVVSLTTPNESNSDDTSDQTDDSSSSSGGSSAAIIGGVALLGVAGIVAYNFFGGAATVAAPAAATVAGSATGVSFGGRIAVVTPCISVLGPSLWVQLAVPASPLLPPYEYIWTPATLLSIVPPIPALLPPSHPGQEILGRFDIPYVCFVGFIPLYGLRVQMGGVSPL
jgi:hypothetical protein